MRKITLWLLMLFMSWQVGAQVTAYSFVASSGGTIDGMTGSTQLIGSASDDGVSAVTPIGFTFNYAGTDYTQFSVNANGLIRLGATAASSSWSNTTANANTNSPAILPYWDDLATGSAAGGGKVHYLLSGTAPNRKLIIEWFVTVPRATTGAANARIQCELQETTNVIRFIYNGVVANTANSGATIGLATSATVYNTVDATTNINSTSTFTTANTVAIPDGTVYTWTPPSCSAPGGIVASAITANSATISWNAANPVPSNGYEYYIDTINTAPTGSGTPEATTSVNVSSLAANTTYYVWVRSDCGGGVYSAWSTVYSFTTLCTTFSAPYAEGFENAGAIPSCWSMSGSENWRFSNTGSGNHIGNNGTITGSTISGGYFAWIDDSTPDTSDATLTSPAIDVSTLTSPTLFFYELSDNEGANPNSTLNVEVWDGAAWNAIATYNTNTNGWTERIIDLSSLTITGDIRVRFIVVESTSFYDDIAIDDVRIDEAPSCFDPINLVASNVTSSSVDFQFDDASGGNQFDFWYVVQPAGTGTSGTLVENYYDPGFGFPMTITCTDVDNDCANTGLQPNTAYEIYVRADCSSNWVGPINFRTLCNAFDTFPFVETFNTDSTSEACWSVINSNGDTDQWNMNGTTIPRSGQAAQLNTDFNSSNNDYLVSPQLDLGTTAKRLKFWVRHYSNSEPDNLNVRISTTGNDIPSFASNLLLSLSTTQITTTYTEYIVDLSAYSGLVYIAFAREDAPADGWYISIDDVTVEETPACPEPTGLTVMNITDTTADFSWTATTGNYEYVLDTNAADPAGSGTAIAGETYSATVLTPETTYYFHVRSDCGSTWTTISFTTPATPPANDECVNAISLTVDANYCDGILNNGHNVGATDSGLTPASCFNYGLNDVWFSFTVPAGVATVNVSTDFTGGTLVDTEIALYSGTCGSLTELDCSQDDGTTILSNGSSWNSLITDTPVTVGETYYVRVAGYSSSAVGTFCLEVSTNQTLSADTFENNSFKAYPNPVKDILTLEYSSDITSVTVFNLLGQQVISRSLNATSTNIDMSQLNAGAYLVSVKMGDVEKTIKVVKQ